MNKIIKILLGIFVLIIVILVIIFYNSNKKEIIKIGVISPLTGNASTYGDPAVKGIIIAAEEINNQGGINGKLVKLIIEDGKCDAKEAVNAMNKLVNIDGVKIVLGGHCSTESLAIAPIANEKKILQLATITSSNKYTKAGDYSFRNWPSSDYYVGKLADIAYERGARKVAILYEQKDFPVAVVDSFKKIFTKNGGEIIIEQSFVSSENDFRSYLTKIKQRGSQIDSLFFASQAENSAISFFKNLKELNMLDKYKLFGNDVIALKKVFNETNGLNKNAITTDTYVNPERPLTKQMLEKYKAKYGDYPQTNYFYVASSYDGLMLIRDGIKQCKSENNVECLKNFLYNTKNWEGASGKLSFDENGDALTQIGIHYFNDKGGEIWEEIE